MPELTGRGKLIENLEEETQPAEETNIVTGAAKMRRLTLGRLGEFLRTHLKIGNKDISGMADGTVTGAITQLSGKFSQYPTTAQMNSALSQYPTTSQMNTALSQYPTTSQMNTALSQYPTTSQMNTALSSFFIVREYIADNVSINSGGIYKFTPTLGVSGYTPIGTVGFSIGNATNSGQNGSYCMVTTSYKSSIGLRNMHPSAVARVKIVAYVLYIKNV